MASSSSSSSNKKSLELKADISFLESNLHDDIGGSAANSSGGIQELHKSQLLRVEVEELLKECQLPLSLHGPAPVHEVRWASSARQYATLVEQLIQKFHVSDVDDPSHSDSNSKSRLFPFLPPELESSKLDHVRLLPPVDDDANGNTKKKSHFKLHMKAASNVALLTKAGNALVVPTLEYLVVLPNQLFQPKDYRNGRYFYKRNVVVQQVAQYLARQTKVVGRVFWRYDQGDTKRPILLLYPPDDDKATTNKNKKKNDSTNRKRSRSSSLSTTTSDGSNVHKAKFRLALHFCMESADWLPTPLRLLPDRSNLGSDSPTPHYNQTLAWESCQLSIHAQLSGHAHSHFHHPQQQQLDMEHDVVDHDILAPHVQQALVLLQVWSLQRGLVRGHDTWTPTTMALMVMYLLRTRRCHARMSPLQIITCLFQFIRDTDWLGDKEDTASSGGVGTTNPSPMNTATGLLRSSPSEAFQDRGFNPTKFWNRTALVMPLMGKTVAQTMELSFVAQNYQPQQPHPSTTLQQQHQKHQKDLKLSQSATTVLQCFQRYAHGPILLDPSLTVNYLYRLSPSFVREWQYQANRSLQILHGVPRPLPALFTTCARFWTRYDLFCYVSPWQSLIHSPTARAGQRHESSSSSSSQLSSMELLVEDVGAHDAILGGLDTLLRQALGDRITAMRAWTTGNGLVVSPDSKPDRPFWEDADEIPTHPVLIHLPKSKSPSRPSMVKPISSIVDRLVLGFALNPDTCHRVVDRGPPADDAVATEKFLQLWGPKAQLRRFQDGAIVYAVVWNDDENNNINDPTMAAQCCSLANDDRMQGEIVQRIVRHIVSLHSAQPKKTSNEQRKKSTSAVSPPVTLQFSLPHLLSVVDGIKPSASTIDSKNKVSQQLLRDPIAAHRQIFIAFEALSSFLRANSEPTLPVPGTIDKRKSRLGLPLAIDSVEPLSPALRYSELFPPLPYASLGDASFSTDFGQQRVGPGVVMSEPILIQIRFGPSSKWPSDLKAIAAAKTAMLIQLANGIDNMLEERGGNDLCSGFQLPSLVTPTYLDIRFRGYLFRVVVRADPELHLLRNLQKPTPEAASLLRTLVKDHVVASMHHSTIHAISTMYPSASAVVRLGKRWIAAHMLSGLIPNEAIELMVAAVYADQSYSSVGSPTTAASGFMRWLHLLSSHDWVRQPLIVNPQGHISDADRETILSQFEHVRGEKFESGPPMYIISPNDRVGLDTETTVTQTPGGTTPVVHKNNNSNNSLWLPTFTRQTPEWVVLSRAAVLAARSYDFLQSLIVEGEDLRQGSNKWMAVFHESPSAFKSYNVLMRVNTDLIVDTESSSRDGDLSIRSENDDSNMMTLTSSYTRILQARYLGPKLLRRKVYRNLQKQDGDDGILLGWRPVDELVTVLREKLSRLALVFYNELSPDIIAILWRPCCSTKHPFSVMLSENVGPVEHDQWKADSYVVTNIHDILRDISQIAGNMITSVKVIEQLN